ncbi:hypothetical protein ACIPSA_43305 [Streptomyces sp. NPDC086549]|uniref:hypothetical protein n=1 Tax=Streptomyces sp. NPDC086549 TaxID=3365752 RepID=UPI003812F4F9
MSDQSAEQAGAGLGVVDDEQQGQGGGQRAEVGAVVVGEVGAQVPGNPAFLADGVGEMAGEAGLALAAGSGHHAYQQGCRAAFAPGAEVGQFVLAAVEGDGFSFGAQ